jgi:hypothetical protein
MRARLPATSGQLEAIDADSCTFTTGASSLQMLAGWLATIGVDFDVREPPELLAHLRRAATRLSRAASG